MRRKDNDWYCERGQTSISKFVEDAICEAIEQTPPKPFNNLEPFEVTLFGYCPRCSERLLTGKNGTRICSSCGLSLRGGIFYALQEYHGHKTVEANVNKLDQA